MWTLQPGAAAVSSRQQCPLGYPCTPWCTAILPSPLGVPLCSCPAGEEALYDEDLGEEEVALELAPVTAQLAYIAERCEGTGAWHGLLAWGLAGGVLGDAVL